MAEKNSPKFPRKISADLKEFSRVCQEHSEELIKSARTLAASGSPHIAYHLAALSLEELGKAVLAKIKSTGTIRKDEDERDALAKHGDDHVQKLFWALWSPSVGGKIITADEFVSIRKLALHIHSTRLDGLYVSPEEAKPTPPKSKITTDQTEELISLAETRLAIAKGEELEDLSVEDAENMSWFMSAWQDPEAAKLIFGGPSLKKLAEFDNHPRRWVAWLKQQFDEADAESRALTERELKRERPEGSEAAKPKWKLNIRLYTNSHSIRPKPLQWWNNGVDFFKLFPGDKKKGELILEFVLPKALPAQGLWWHGWGMSRSFVVALNIGTMGFFWWYVPKQVSRYYESIRDLESKSDMVVERSPALKLAWKQEALSQHLLGVVGMCLGAITKIKREDHKTLDHYLTGLGFMSKTDVHMQFEANAYEHFYKALKYALILYKDWDGSGDPTLAVGAWISEFLEDEDQKAKYLELCRAFEAERPKPDVITLEEVAMMKVLAEAYYLKKFRKQFDEARAEKSDAQLTT